MSEIAGGTFWGREVQILAGEEGKQVPVITEHLKCGIKIRKSLKKTPNSSELVVQGLT